MLPPRATPRPSHAPRASRFILAAASACLTALPLVLAATAAPASAATVNYVAMGDSYASGLGAGNLSGGSCDRSSGAADQLWANAHSPASFAFVACAGATTADIINSQVSALSSSTTLVSVTIGGNDVLGWYGDTRAALRAADAAVAATDRALDRLRRLADPSARIVLGTVYDPSDGTADAARVGLPPWPEVIEVLAHLNAALRSLADRHGAAVADIHARFLGHGLAAGDPGQADPRPEDRNLWYCDIIEPNAWGAGAVREAFWTALGHPAPDDGAECST